jgi:hypothetical protein
LELSGFKTVPGRLEDAVVPQRFVSQKSVKRYGGASARSTVPFSCQTWVILGQLPSITWPSRGENIPTVYESVGGHCGHRSALASSCPSAQRSHGRYRVARPAEDPHEDRRALGPRERSCSSPPPKTSGRWCSRGVAHSHGLPQPWPSRVPRSPVVRSRPRWAEVSFLR